MSLIKNPFTHPSEINQEINKEIRRLIINKFRSKSGLDFNEMAKYFMSKAENKDMDRAKIAAYYCTNTIINNKDIQDSEKASMILEFQKVIKYNELSPEEAEKINQNNY